MNIVFCLPGNSFSGRFLSSWTTLLQYCQTKGYNAILSQRYSSNVYYVRSKCLGASSLRGKKQQPFNGKLKYNYLMWIDSDIIFTVNDFDKLMSYEYDIISGLYLMDGGKEFATVEHWNEREFSQTGKFHFLTPNDLINRSGVFSVAYTGFGFMRIKYGVFETLEYPWFAPEFMQMGTSWDFTSEDVGFCLRAKKAGYHILVDPSICVRHEKTCLY